MTGADERRLQPVRARNLTWLVPTLVSLGFSASIIGRTTLGRDEMATWQFSRLSWNDLFAAVGNVDGVLAPHYLLMRLWGSVDDGAVWLRLPSALAVAAAVAVAARLGQRAWGSWAGLLTGLALALHPVVAAWAVEARPYAGAMLFATIGTALVFSPGPFRPRWYAVVMAAAVALHLFAVTVVFAHVLVVGRLPARRLAILAPAFVVGLVALPIALVAHSQRLQVAYIPMPTVSTTLSVTRAVAVPAEYLWLAVGALAVLVLGPVLSRAPGRIGARIGAWPGITLIVVTPLLLFVASHLLSPVLRERYLIAAPLGAALVLGAAIGVLGQRRVLQTLALVAVIAVAVPGVRAVHAPRFNGTDFRLLDATLSAQARAGDGLEVAIRRSQGGLPAGVAYYTHDRRFLADVLHGLPDLEPLTYRRLFTGTRATTATTGLRPIQWLVAVNGTTPALQAVRGLRSAGCVQLSYERTGDLALFRFRCPAEQSADQ